MGVSVPNMKVNNLIRRVHERGYGFLSTNAKLDDAAKNFEESILLIVKLAEIEESVRRIAEEVEKTKRRVNALEYIVIPRLKATIKHIEMRMEEIERESSLPMAGLRRPIRLYGIQIPSQAFVAGFVTPRVRRPVIEVK